MLKLHNKTVFLTVLRKTLRLKKLVFFKVYQPPKLNLEDKNRNYDYDLVRRKRTVVFVEVDKGQALDNSEENFSLSLHIKDDNQTYYSSYSNCLAKIEAESSTDNPIDKKYCYFNGRDKSISKLLVIPQGLKAGKVFTAEV